MLNISVKFHSDIPYRKGIKGHKLFEPQHEFSFNVVCATSKASDQPAHMHSLIRAFASCLNSMAVKLLTLNHLELLSLKGGCTGSYESKFVKMSYCGKSHAAAHFQIYQAKINHELERSK